MIHKSMLSAIISILLVNTVLAVEEKPVVKANFDDKHDIILKITNENPDHKNLNSANLFLFIKDGQGGVIVLTSSWHSCWPDKIERTFGESLDDREIRSFDLLIMYGPNQGSVRYEFDTRFEETKNTPKEMFSWLKKKYPDAKYIFTENIKIEPGEKKTGKEAIDSK